MIRGEWSRPGARRAILLVFLCCGFGSAIWAALVPFLKLRLALGEASLGGLLLGFGAGAILAMPFSGRLIQRFGSRQVIRIAGLLIAAAFCLMTAVPLLPSGVARAAAVVPVLLLGAAFGTLDVAMNAQAVLLETRSARPMMSSFHALYSLGGLVGAAAISVLLRLGLPSPACALVGASAIATILLTQHRHLLPPGLEARAAGSTRFSLPRGRALVIGLMCVASFLAEGAVLDWGAVLLRFSRGIAESWAGLGYAGFSVAMAAGRLTGDRLTRLAGPRRMVLAGGLLTASGFAVAVTIPSGAATVLGFLLVGLGAANIVPVLLSAASRLPGPPARTIAAVTTLGYAGLLAGPAAIGAVAQATSLPLALGLVGLLMLGVAAGARTVGR